MNAATSIATTIILITTGFSTSNAQTNGAICTALLQNGVFDQTNKTQLTTSYSHVRDAFCSSTYSQAGEGRTKALQAGIPVDGLLVPFGYKQDDNSYSTARSAFCSQSESNLYLNDSLTLAIRQADAALAEQFTKCIATMSSGTLEYFINAGADPSTFQVKTIYRQGADKVYPIVKNLSIRPDDVAKTCDQGSAFNLGHRLGLDESFTCTRQPGQGVTVSLSTSIATTSSAAVLPPYRNERIVKDERMFDSAPKRFASKNTDEYGPEVCVDAPQGYDFDMDPRVVYDVARGNILGDASQAPGRTVISVKTTKKACGYGETRPYSDSETYTIIYHVTVRGRSQQLVVDGQSAK